eukprot:422254-Pyramimonas_sp.AAC.1
MLQQARSRARSACLDFSVWRRLPLLPASRGLPGFTEAALSFQPRRARHARDLRTSWRTPKTRALP